MTIVSSSDAKRSPAALRHEALKLFCFPCAGGSAAEYWRWRRLMPSWISVRPVEYPGHGSRLAETPLRRYEALVARLTDEIEREAVGCFAFFGHSVGALVAHGCAHALRSRGAPTPCLIIAACAAAPSKRDDSALAALRTDAELIAELRKLNGTPEELFDEPELLRMTLDVVSADFAILGHFAYRRLPPLDADLLVVAGQDDDIDNEALLAWEEETTQASTVRIFSGGHFFFRTQESCFIDFLARRLSDATRSERS